MSGGFWAGSVPPWASVVMVLTCLAVFILGMVAGMDFERRRGVRGRPGRGERRRLADAAADRAGARAAGQFRAMRLELHHEPDPEAAARRAAMARRTHPVYRQISTRPRDRRGTSTAAFLESRPPSMLEPFTFNDDPGSPIDTGEIRAIREDMDVWLAGLLAAHPVPYEDGSGQ